MRRVDETLQRAEERMHRVWEGERLKVETGKKRPGDTAS